MGTVTDQTRVWVGLKTCGCCVAVCVDDPSIARKDVDRSKRQFLKDGLSVVSASWDEWQTKYLPAMKFDCTH